MSTIFMAVLLIPMAVEDVLKKQLSLQWMLICGSAGAICNVFFESWGLHNLAAGIVIGSVLLIVSRANSSIGAGDGVLFLAVGLISGWEGCMQLLTGSACICLPAGVFLKWIKHKENNYEIPFTPFVLAAWLGQVFI